MHLLINGLSDLKKLNTNIMKKVILLLVLAFSLGINAQEKTEDSFKKTDDVLSEVVKKALVVAEKTGNFVIEQAPDLLQEFYNWHLTKSIFTAVISLIFIIALWLLIRKLRKKADTDHLDFADAEYFFPMAFSGVGILGAIIYLITSLYDLVFILVAPKLYLIEYFIK